MCSGHPGSRILSSVCHRLEDLRGKSVIRSTELRTVIMNRGPGLASVKRVSNWFWLVPAAVI